MPPGPQSTGGMSTPSGPVLVTPSGQVVGTAFAGSGGGGSNNFGGNQLLLSDEEARRQDEAERQRQSAARNFGGNQLLLSDEEARRQDEAERQRQSAAREREEENRRQLVILGAKERQRIERLSQEEASRLGVAAGLARLPGESDAAFSFRSAGFGRSVASLSPTQPANFLSQSSDLTGGMSVAPIELDNNVPRRSRFSFIPDLFQAGSEVGTSSLIGVGSLGFRPREIVTGLGRDLPIAAGQIGIQSVEFFPNALGAGVITRDESPLNQREFSLSDIRGVRGSRFGTALEEFKNREVSPVAEGAVIGLGLAAGGSGFLGSLRRSGIRQAAEQLAFDIAPVKPAPGRFPFIPKESELQPALTRIPRDIDLDSGFNFQSFRGGRPGTLAEEFTSFSSGRARVRDGDLIGGGVQRVSTPVGEISSTGRVSISREIIDSPFVVRGESLGSARRRFNLGRDEIGIFSGNKEFSDGFKTDVFTQFGRERLAGFSKSINEDLTFGRLGARTQETKFDLVTDLRAIGERGFKFDERFAFRGTGTKIKTRSPTFDTKFRVTDDTPFFVLKSGPTTSLGDELTFTRGARKRGGFGSDFKLDLQIQKDIGAALTGTQSRSNIASTIRSQDFGITGDAFSVTSRSFTPFAGTGAFERTGELSLPTLSRSSGQSFGIGNFGSSRNNLGGGFTFTPLQSDFSRDRNLLGPGAIDLVGSKGKGKSGLGTISGSLFGSIETPIPRNPQVPILENPLEPPRRGPPRFGFGDFSISPPRRGFDILSPLPGGDLFGFSPRARSSKRKLKRTPSIGAILLDITSPTEDPFESTGLVLRPVIRKRKKRRK